MTSENLQRTSYRDPNTTNDQVRSGTPTLAENERDMDQYYRPLERIHSNSLHGWGVANGLGVTATLNSANPNLTILPGVALDSSGEHISLAPPPPSNPTVPSYAEVGLNPTGLSTGATLVPVTAGGVVIPTTNLTGDKYLTIQFWETFDSNSYNNLGLFIYWHTPWLQLVDVASFTNKGNQVVLAKVSFAASPNAGQVTALTLDLRQSTDLPVGSIHLQRSLATSPSAGAEAVSGVEAGVIRAYTTGGLSGLDITVPNGSDEIHLERDDGTNFAKVSLGAEKIVARKGDGTTESVVIDSEAGSLTTSGNISATNITATGTIQGGSLTSTGNILANGSVNVGVVDSAIPYPKMTVTGPDATVNIETAEILRVMRHGVSGVKNQNSAGFFVGAFEAGINGRSQLDIKVAGTPGNPNTWGSVPDVTVMSLQGDGNIVATGNITAGSVSTNAVTTNGEVVVKNAPGTDTIVLDGNGAMIDVGASGADGGITVYDKTHTAIFIVNGQNGKTTVKTLKVSAGVTAQETGNWALGGFASQGAIGLRAANGGNQADLGTTQYAGNFTGGVNISGSLHVSGPIIKSGGGFKIDHPCDPKSKYLAHSFVESPDMKNIYDGVAVLDANGEAIVELPEWFAALNRDVRYQLTCIGDYAPVYIGRKMQGTSFKIAGGKPEMEVSWQVTGIRQDAWARAHPICTEEMKPTEEQGYYLHPEEIGADPAMSIHQLHRSQSV